MAHEFESGFFVGESAWHKLGTTIPIDDPRRFSVSDSLELAQLTWTVELATAAWMTDDAQGLCSEHFATVRRMPDGTVQHLGMVGSRYKPLQNREAFEWFQPWLDTKEVAIETAGSLRGGKLVWVLAKLNRDNIILPGGDEISKYLMLSTSHDGTEATRIGFTPVRIVCANTLRAAHQDQASKLLRVRHTASQLESLAAIRETIDLVDQEFVATGDQYRRLLECKINASDVRAYVKLVCGVHPDLANDKIPKRTAKRIDRMVDLALNGIGNSPTDISAWSAYNGVTQYLTHEAGNDAEQRAVSKTYAELNDKAFRLALQLSA